MMNRILPFCLMALAGTLSAKPLVIQYSAQVTDRDQRPRTDIINKKISFSLFLDSTYGYPVWTEDDTVTAPKGFITVMLGKNSPLPVKVIDTAANIYLEMKIGSESPFRRQRIASSFYSISAAVADTARYSKEAGHAKKSDSLGNYSAANYALKTGIPGIPSKVDSSLYARRADTATFANIAARARKADSLGNYVAGSYALKSDLPSITGVPSKVDSSIYARRADTATFANIAARARKADSLGNYSAITYALKSELPSTPVIVDSSRTAKDADSLGGLVASRYISYDANGRVGIGMATTSHQLEVKNHLSVYNSTEPAKRITLYHGPVGAEINTADALSIKTGSNNVNRIYFKSDYTTFIGIANTNPQYTLDVTGNIRATGTVYYNGGPIPPDYVFEDGYPLMPLGELEQYIKTNKHLPGVPSASEMQNKSVDLSKMNNALLEKIEELTLHILAMEKRISELESSR